MSALNFDPWTLLKTQIEKSANANPANPAKGKRGTSPRLAGLAGLALARSAHSKPPHIPCAWSYPAFEPAKGDWCSCCRGQRFWRKAEQPTGWCCRTCHPPDHLDAEQIIEVRT
jgi:hypothetical protein